MRAIAELCRRKSKTSLKHMDMRTVKQVEYGRCNKQSNSTSTLRKIQ